MSQENVETLRAFLQMMEDIPALVETARNEGVDSAFAALDADVVYEDENLPDHIGEAYRGRDGILRAAERWADASKELTLQLDEIIGSGDRFVSIHLLHSRARHSGIDFDVPLAYAWTFREGRIVHIQSYTAQRSSRSRWPLGVGDVAGERGDCQERG